MISEDRSNDGKKPSTQIALRIIPDGDSRQFENPRVCQLFLCLKQALKTVETNIFTHCRVRIHETKHQLKPRRVELDRLKDRTKRKK